MVHLVQDKVLYTAMDFALVVKSHYRVMLLILARLIKLVVICWHRNPIRCHESCIG